MAPLRMTVTELSLAILALLITPGPTNTLMFLAGAERGVARAMRLIPAELSGYLLAVVPLALAGGGLMAAVPHARLWVGLAAGVWVATLALRLWRLPQADGTAARVDARMVFVTTFLNPKALIFGLVLLPSAQGLAGSLANFSAQVCAVATLWILAGALTAARPALARRRLGLVRRAAALWLAALSVLLILRSLAAA